MVRIHRSATLSALPKPTEIDMGLVRSSAMFLRKIQRGKDHGDDLAAVEPGSGSPGTPVPYPNTDVAGQGGDPNDLESQQGRPQLDSDWNEATPLPPPPTTAQDGTSAFDEADALFGRRTEVSESKVTELGEDPGLAVLEMNGIIAPNNVVAEDDGRSAEVAGENPGWYDDVSDSAPTTQAQQGRPVLDADFNEQQPAGAFDTAQPDSGDSDARQYAAAPVAIDPAAVRHFREATKQPTKVEVPDVEPEPQVTDLNFGAGSARPATSDLQAGADRMADVGVDGSDPAYALSRNVDPLDSVEMGDNLSDPTFGIEAAGLDESGGELDEAELETTVQYAVDSDLDSDM